MSLARWTITFFAHAMQKLSYFGSWPSKLLNATGGRKTLKKTYKIWKQKVKYGIVQSNLYKRINGGDGM